MPEDNQDHKPVLHIGYLDSVRGILATIVVIYHFLNWDYHARTKVKIVNFVFNGADAVGFFFVLSGFVLAYKYLALKHEMDIGKFYINRFFRLWPAFFLTVVINALYHVSLHLELSWNTLFEIFILNKHRFWQEAALVRSVPFVYYVPGWTLVIEMIMSLFIPFAVIIGHKNKNYMWWLAGFFALATPGLLGMGAFLTNFVYGALVAAFYTAISGGEFRNTRLYKFRYLILLLGIICYSMRPLEKMFQLGSFYDEFIFGYLGYNVDYFSGFGSLIMLVFIIQSRRIQKVLELGILRFLGKLSYGIYLMHWLVVTWIFNNKGMLFSYFPGEKVAIPCLLVGCIVVTILMALPVYYFVELPFIRLGKRLTGKMRPTVMVQP